MLPFLKKNNESAAMGDEDESIMRKRDEGGDYEMLDAIADDMMAAIEKKDKATFKSALDSLCEYIRQEDEEQDSEQME